MKLSSDYARSEIHLYGNARNEEFSAVRTIDDIRNATVIASRVAVSWLT
jgi:hypothetical protein